MTLKYITDDELAAEDIASFLDIELGKNKKLLWLVSGGSALKVATKARGMLSRLNSKRGELHIGLIDERYGDVGHKDSNWQQLIDSGFDMSRVFIHPVLQGSNSAKTTEDYNNTLASLFEDVDSVIGLFGVGSDGHTSGLLPNNSFMNSEKLVVYYQGPDYQRITTTPALIPQVDKCFVYSIGSSKWLAIKQMLEPGSESDVPARILLKARDLSVYTDYKGD